MKKLICGALILLCTFNALSQQNVQSAISYLPYQANNYLILDFERYPTVVDWNIEIKEPTSIDASGQVVFTRRARIQISDTYFTKIDPSYNTGDHFITVVGTNLNGDIVVEEGPIPICTGCPSDGQTCVSICKGPDYAWQGKAYQYIDQFGNYGPLSLYIHPTGNPSTGQPFYQYFSLSQFSQLQSSGDPNYYGLNGSFNYPQGNKIIIEYGVTAAQGLKDVQGNILTGTVYGVQMHLGPWAGNSDILAQNLAIPFASLCSGGVPTMINIINTNSFSNWLTPDLACTGTSINVGGGGVESMADDAFEAINNCHAYFEAWLSTPFTDPVALFDAWEAYQACLDQFSTNPTPGLNWPADVAVINISPYWNGTNGTTYSFKEEDIFLPNGEIVSPTINLIKGMYCVGIQFLDGSYLTIFAESKDENTIHYPQSSFLDANIFPVPINGNGFNLDLQTSARLSFDYVLLDFNGNELYRQTFVLEKDHDRTHYIDVTTGIPNGQLVNKFIFDDRSELQIITTK